MNIKNIVIAVLVAAVLVLGYVDLSGIKFGGGFTDEYNEKVFHNTVSFAGAISNSSTLTIGTGGTAISSYKCTSVATWNPASVSSSTASASLAVNTGATSLGDTIIVSLNSATSTNLWTINGAVTAAGTTNGTTTVYLRGVEGAAVDLSTSTVKICQIR